MLQPREAQFQRTVIELAQLLGWRVHAERPAQTQSGRWSTPIQGDRGFPDLILARDGRLVALELKSQAGRIGPGQVEWIEAFAAAGATARIVRPSDWAWIEATLRGER